MLQLQNVTKRYKNGHEALKNLSFHLDKGELVFLTGHSGAGKTSLLKLISLLEFCSEGLIKLDGQNLNNFSKRKIPLLRRKLGIIFQQPHLLIDQTLFDNVALPLLIAGLNPRKNAKAIAAALDQVGLAGRERDFPTTLSAGEQQRLSIARAIISEPKILLADEPTGNLDPALALDIMRLFERLNQAGMTILIASHDLALIARLKHRVITLAKGRLVNDGKNAT